MSTTTKVDGLIDALRSRILSGEFGKEGRLPSFRNLATEYQTTQETMNKTMQALQAEGLLTSLGAKGVFVNTPFVHTLGYKPDFYKFLQKNVSDPLEEYIEKPSVMPVPDEVAEIMGIQKKSVIFHRFKRQGTKQVIFRTVETFYPKNILPNEAIEEMTTNVSYMPMKSIKDKFGYSINHINETILTRLPTAKEQENLKIVRTNPIIDLKRICYDKETNKVIFYANMILNANHFLLSYNYEVDNWDKM